jgi:siderophore synthetase component
MTREKGGTKEELMETIRTVWEELDQEMLNRMVAGFERRLATSLKSEGEAYPLICHPIEASQLLRTQQ